MAAAALPLQVAIRSGGAKRRGPAPAAAAG
jgi:hypothetical protein